ncbi:TlpA family protein disulfide reductase [Natrarchaeobaculum sulfurireducens]|uniref:Thioredoxin n=1 Tax=Natrarchaeobaculum sulfurireducens TaxID=2044521 RepID=A0A346PNA9_9EURY|nr:redoxin family protein [Natrarchaeobaculum sulfurireducens]AXR81004.1 thioredoxin [Natrarchaeobaculum sulfurireducens]
MDRGRTVRLGLSPTRRRLLIGASLVATAGCLEADAGDEPAAGSDDEPDGPPFELTTVDAPGSEAGTTTVPASDRSLLVNFTRTGCPTSEGLLENVDDAADRLGAARDLEPNDSLVVLSVIDTTFGSDESADELADWWTSHDGNWPLGIDEDGALTDHYDVGGFPVLVVIDADGAVRWHETDATATDSIVDGVADALED